MLPVIDQGRAAYVKGAPLLQIANVGMTFGDRVILRDVNATVVDLQRVGQVQGQVVAFLGPSGIGKSTLSTVIAGLRRPTTGTVLLDRGKPTLSLVRCGDVGFVPQQYPLFEFATVWDNLLIAGKQGGLTAGDRERKIDELLTDLGLREYRSLYPAALSGGTRQRVAIARQLMCAGSTIVMDEPFSGQDPIAKAATARLIVDVANRDEKNVLIVVTHDILQGLSVADTVWLMGRQGSKPGATIVEELDLAAEDLCWRGDLQADPRFLDLVRFVTNCFGSLKDGTYATRQA